MARFIYRKDLDSHHHLRPILPYQAEMLDLKLAAAETKLDELKILLQETKEQRDRWQSQAEQIAKLAHDQKILLKSA